MNGEDILGTRVATLEQAFRQVAATRMQGVPLLHAALRVQALGFQPLADEPGVALGVLVTPWFMNLIRLPLDAAAEAAMPATGQDVAHELAGQRFDFLGAHDPDVGAFAMCSLFSPMFEFIDQAAAAATAREVLLLLRPPVAAPLPMVPARRGFLFGRSAAAGSPP